MQEKNEKKYFPSCIIQKKVVPLHSKMKRMLLILVVICMLAAGLPAVAADNKADKKTAELAQKLKKNPGNIDLRCEYVGALLQQGDTVRAEEALDYGAKLGEAGCLQLHRARIALSRGKNTNAALCCALAVNAGVLPEEEPLIFSVDSLTGGGVATRLNNASKASKSNYYSIKALGQIRLHAGDSTAALNCFQEAFRRGDTTLVALIDTLKKAETLSEDSVVARIAFTRTDGKMEVTCTLNGLKIKAEVDTTAVESSISGVETTFILKNEYVSRSDIVDNSVLVVRELDFGNGLLLSSVRLHHKRAQESPVVLCLSDLRQLGRIVINEREKVLEVRR